MRLEELLEMTRSQVLRDTIKNNKQSVKHVVRGLVRKNKLKREVNATMHQGEGSREKDNNVEGQDPKDAVGLNFVQ